MASGAGVDLAHRNPRSGDAPGVVIGLLITFDDGEAELLRQVMQGTFEQGRLAGTGRADQVQDKNSLFLEYGAVKTGQAVVFTQNVFFDGDLRPLPGFSVMMVMMFAFVVVAVFVAMIAAVMMIVVVVIGRGTSAGCAH